MEMDSRHLHRIVELADEKCVGEVVKDVHQHAEHAGQGHVNYRPGNGHLFQYVDVTILHYQLLL